MLSSHRPMLLLASFLISTSFGGAAELEKPRLLVLVVFDQMRGDYPERWQALYGNGGFNLLRKEGAFFPNCHYPYATTTTGPGHASILTGCSADSHGIINNEWYDTKTAKVINCAESARYRRVPESTRKMPEPEELKKEGLPKLPSRPKLAGSPDYLMAPTLGDALKEATGGKARVVGLSFKDRSALLPVGKSADAVYWLDSADGTIVTSSFYRDSVHPWVAEFNEKRSADEWFGKPWSKLRTDLDYEKYSGRDDAPGEGTGIKQGVIFPHPIDGGLKKPGKNYYEAVYNSPFGNDMLIDLVRRAVVAEKLGKDDVTDLLVVSFSSNDAIGHTWGPDSQEVLDVTLRSDKLLADFLAFLDREVGKGKYLLALTADHGICPLPEATATSGTFAVRIPAKKLLAGAQEHLRTTFDKGAEKSLWIENASPPWIYLNQNLIAARGLRSAEVEKVLADYLAKQEGIYRTYTRADLAGEFPETDPIGRRMKHSYYAERSGDVGIVIAPYCLLTENFKWGTTHGSPHAYDTHVPLLIYGSGIQPGIHREPVTPQAVASIFAAAAGIKPPKRAAYPVPEGLFGKK